jgi:long-chain fatty acid transport protein
MTARSNSRNNCFPLAGKAGPPSAFSAGQVELVAAGYSSAPRGTNKKMPGHGFACHAVGLVGNYAQLARVQNPGWGMLTGRHKPGLFLALAAMMLAATAGKSRANGFRLMDQDAFATARGEAFTATADNASAIYYNPAGITQLDGNNLRSGIDGIYVNADYRPPSTAANAGNTYNDIDHFAAIPQLFLTHTFDSVPLSAGVGVYAPFGGKVNWPEDTGFRTVATRGALAYTTINPVIAYKVLPSLSIAVGATFNYGKIDLEQGLRPLAYPLQNYFLFKGLGWSYGYNAGIRWQPLDQLSFGAKFQSISHIDFNGYTEFEQEPILQSQQVPAVANFVFPLTAVSGISYRPTTNWNVEFDADYTGWNSFSTVTIAQGPTPFPVQQNVPVTLQWRPSWAFELGATRYFGENWQVSAGYMFNENSVPDTYYSPLAADMDRYFLSLGGGYHNQHLSIDLTYQFGYGPTHAVAGSTPSSSPGLFAGQSADGSYGFISHAVIASVGLHF